MPPHARDRRPPPRPIDTTEELLRVLSLMESGRAGLAYRVLRCMPSMVEYAVRHAYGEGYRAGLEEAAGRLPPPRALPPVRARRRAAGRPSPSSAAGHAPCAPGAGEGRARP